MRPAPCIFYNYTSTTASKLFNYKQNLQGLNVEHQKDNPQRHGENEEFKVAFLPDQSSVAARYVVRTF